MEKQWISLTASQWLDSMSSLYSVDSEVIPRLHYAVKGQELLVLRDHQIYRIGLHEAEEWIRRCIIPEMAEEMREVLADIVSYKRGSRRYGQKQLQVSDRGGEAIRCVQLQREVLRDIERALL